MKVRLGRWLVEQGLAPSRSQAESYIKLGRVQVNGQKVTKSEYLVGGRDRVKLSVNELYVGRAALKLASVADVLGLDFRNKVVLDVGSSTGGFTDYALKCGAKKVIAVDVGTGQLHPSLQANERVELHEKTDIRQFEAAQRIDIAIIDVSFISLREILPAVTRLSTKQTRIVAMVKPQFEAGADSLKHKGVIKNERLRRAILKDFEEWARRQFVIIDKADSEVSGRQGNRERFYLLRKL